MDYKQKYEQALEYMHTVYPTLTGAAKEDVEHHFPELKESEDESIRKHLLKHFRNKTKEEWNGMPIKNILAWLEKQGLQKQSEWNADDVWNYNQIMDILKDCNQTKLMDWLEKQDPKKQEEELEKAYKTADEVQYRRGYEAAKREFEEQGKQKPIEDRRILTVKEIKVGDIITYFRDNKKGIMLVSSFDAGIYPRCKWGITDIDGTAYGDWAQGSRLFYAATEKEKQQLYNTMPECVKNWLKSLRPQLKQEWTEEDEKFFKTALWHISHSISNGKSTDIQCDTTDWLKSLRQRMKENVY